MSVQFEEDRSFRPNQGFPEKKPSAAARLIMSLGITQDSAMAEKIALGIALVLIVGAFIYFFSQNSDGRPSHTGRTPIPAGVDVGGFK